MNTGITITNDLSIDWFDLGVNLATLGSDDQAAMLEGFQAGLRKLGGLQADMQIEWIAEAIGKPNWFITQLAEAIN